MNKLVWLLAGGLLLLGASLFTPQPVLAYNCLAECIDACDAAVTSCEASCDPTVIEPDYDDCLAACADTTACIDACDALGLPVSCPVSTTTSSLVATSSTSTAPDFSKWLTIVPVSCQQKAGGCSICDITKVFTNAADLISAALSAISLLMFVVGGLFWIFSGGVEQRVETGKKIIVGTVTGLGIVFVAWFAVNIIVRTASLSGGTTSTAKVFSSEWWEFEGCYPKLPESCAGAYIGESCLKSPCESGSYKDPRCTCWRARSAEGDAQICKEDAASLSEVTSSESNPANKCICQDACNLAAATTGDKYTCENRATVDKNEALYDIRTDLICSAPNTVCVKPK